MYLLYIKDDSKGATTNLIFSPIDNCSDKNVYFTMSLTTSWQNCIYLSINKN